MKTIKLFAEYMPQFNAFCIKDEEVKEVLSQEKIPEIYLKNQDILDLGGTESSNAPLVGFLMGRETGYFSIDFNYAKAIVQSGVNIRFITYENVTKQMEKIDALILPGGAFSSPDFFYDDNIEEYTPNNRYEAYETAIIVALQKKIPILGICAGAQMVAAVMGGRLSRNIQQYTEINHKTKALDAHEVTILPGNPLSEIFPNKKIETNSRHKEGLNPNVPFSLSIYAVAEDGIPEAWGNERKKILCIQWHPEDFAAEGNQEMQGIYNWLVKQIAK